MPFIRESDINLSVTICFPNLTSFERTDSEFNSVFSFLEFMTACLGYKMSHNMSLWPSKQIKNHLLLFMTDKCACRF